MNILTLEQFDNDFLPLLRKKYWVHAILQRKSGMRAFETGLKTYKAPIVRPLELDFEKRTISVIGKQNKKREIPTKIPMVDIQEHYRKRKMPTYTAYKNAVKLVYEEIGIRPWQKKQNDMWTHTFRADFIIDWIMRFGTTIQDLQMLIGITGHKSIKELQPYLDYMGTQSGIEKYHERF